MQIKKIANVTIFTSEEICRELEKADQASIRHYGTKASDSESDVLIALWRMTLYEKIFRGRYEEYLSYFMKATGLREFAILHAHGSYNGRGRWMYTDRGRQITVQRWIKENDGKFACLVCWCCNPISDAPYLGGENIQTKKSLIAVCDRAFSETDILKGDSGWTLIDPMLGEIEGYTIDWAIEQWRQKAEEKK